MASRTRLVLIRHGESNAQVAGLVSGHDTCTGLSERGVEQARALATFLAKSGDLADVDVVYTSLLLRAQQTALAIAEAVGSPPIDQSCAWCEIHPGVAEGLTWDEMRIRFPPAGNAYDPVARRLPEMETWAEMYERVGESLDKAAREHAGGTVVAVTSGGPVGASFVTLGGETYEEGIVRTRETMNTSITEWQLVGDTWTLIRHSDTPHLDRSSNRKAPRIAGG
jgi:probable phosphoglycerate mutase